MSVCMRRLRTHASMHARVHTHAHTHTTYTAIHHTYTRVVLCAHGVVVLCTCV